MSVNRDQMISRALRRRERTADAATAAELRWSRAAKAEERAREALAVAQESSRIADAVWADLMAAQD